jgi:putative oxidoreductase
LAHALERLRWALPLSARFLTGWVFIESGLGKLRHLDVLSQFFLSLGFPKPLVLAGVVASSEALFGMMLLAGLLTRAACLPLLGILATALVTLRGPELEGASDLFSTPELLFGVLLAWLLVEGPGPVSLDHVLFRKWKRSE